jgi:hypothetical protein
MLWHSEDTDSGVFGTCGDCNDSHPETDTKNNSSSVKVTSISQSVINYKANISWPFEHVFCSGCICICPDIHFLDSPVQAGRPKMPLRHLLLVLDMEDERCEVQ